MTEKLKFNDRIIDDGFPENFFIQDRLDTNEALLCVRTKSYIGIGGPICLCLRPKAITTDEWIPTARILAIGYRNYLNVPNLVRHKKRGTNYEIVSNGKLQTSIPLEDGTEIIIYKAVGADEYWARSKQEFEDGRFEPW
jgi:hypothetical protein